MTIGQLEKMGEEKTNVLPSKAAEADSTQQQERVLENGLKLKMAEDEHEIASQEADQLLQELDKEDTHIETLSDKEKLERTQGFIEDINRFIANNSDFYGSNGSKNIHLGNMEIDISSSADDGGALNSLSLKNEGKKILEYKYSASMWHDKGEWPVNVTITANNQIAFYNGNVDKETDGRTKGIYKNYDVIESAGKYLQEIKNAIEKGNK